MNSVEPRSKTNVLIAAAVIVVLAGLLGARILARSASNANAAPVPPPTSSVVPAPAPSVVGDLEIPCWSCPSSAKQWPVRFQTDLDLLAPLGTGGENAGIWFKDFSKPDGPRFDEAVAFMGRRFDHDGDMGKIVAGDDSLLLEAEPWCDQAKMFYYPDIFPLEGWQTKIPNLLVPLTFARSWVARGLADETPARGLEDCRRAIRLGRVLRQEDVVIINDLVGLACIHLGARGVYEIAMRTGDLELALLASIVVGEVAPQRLTTVERVGDFDLAPYLAPGQDGVYRLDLPDERLAAMIGQIGSGVDRRFLGEAVIFANVVLFHGTAAQGDRIREVLDRLAASEDPINADLARRALDTPPDPELLAEISFLARR